MIDLFVTLAMILVGIWILGNSFLVRDENRALRREVARLSKHPSTHMQSIRTNQPLPYMRRYADDED